MVDQNKKSKKNEPDVNERLRMAEDTLDAIRKGAVDALIIHGPKGEQHYSLISPDHPYQVFFENMDEAAIILSNENVILYANKSFFNMIESSLNIIIGTSILDLISKEDVLHFTTWIQSKEKKKTELSLVTKRQETRTVLASVFKGVWKESEQQCLLLMDITPLKRAKLFIEDSESIAKILSAIPDLSPACKSIIHLLKNHLGWEVMVIWIWNKESRQLHCMEVSHIEGIDIETFEKKTRAIETEQNMLACHAGFSNRPVWIEDLMEHADFLRRNEATKNGLRGALALPFNQDFQLAGVIELFSRTPFKETIDDLFLDWVSSIGIHVGIYIQRLFSNQQSSQFIKAINLSLNSIYSLDMNGIVMSWNPGAEAIYGWKAHEIIGKEVRVLFPEGKHDELDRMYEELNFGKTLVKGNSKRVQKNGNFIWIHHTFDALLDFFGNISGVIIVEQDVTTEQTLTESIAKTQEQLNSFIDITEVWFFEIYFDGTFYFSNDIIHRLLDYDTDEIMGKSLLYLLTLENRGAISDRLKACVKEKQGWSHMTLPLVHKNGSTCWIESSIKPLLGKNNEVIGFRGAGRDVTEQKNLDKIKNEFISIVSHELRTPLTSIYGALTLLIGREMNPQERTNLLTVAQRNAEVLTKLINDTMDIEKIQLGKMQFCFKTINLRDVVQESIFSSKIIANKFNIKIITTGPLLDAEVNGDHIRLLQVMTNLLSNAIKFSPNQGTVEVSMERQNNAARVSVRDYGQGVPENFQSKIFHEFKQADSSIKRPFGGSGLGLYISKSIIEAHGGTINYRTKAGVGTTFFFDIPLLVG